MAFGCAPPRLMTIAVAVARLVARAQGETCPGRIHIAEGPSTIPVSMVPTGWHTKKGPALLEVVDGRKLLPHMDSRAYFATECIPGQYSNHQYMAPKLLGKTVRYTTDMSGAGCGCNAAFYLTSMRHNERPSECFDFYCDANNVCGESCTEIDIQEANMEAWHSTLHTSGDHNGVGKGIGGGGRHWDGPRDWSTSEYGKGASCIDTAKPFQVTASFPVNAQGVLQAMEVNLTQARIGGHNCTLSVRLDQYEGMERLSDALAAGMTPVVSYWSANDMLWLDGRGKDHLGACATDDMSACGESVKFYDFAITSLTEDGRAEVAHRDGAGEQRGSSKSFCCMAAPDPTNFCGSCPAYAKVGAGSICGSSATACQRCGGGVAHWCAEEEEGDADGAHDVDHEDRPPRPPIRTTTPRPKPTTTPSALVRSNAASTQEEFCCLAARSSGDFCGTCFPSAKATLHSHCGASKDSCQACGGTATWCGPHGAIAFDKVLADAPTTHQQPHHEATINLEPPPRCPGVFEMATGDSDSAMPLALVPTGWTEGGRSSAGSGKKFVPVDVQNRKQVVPHMGGRAYFAHNCTPGIYDNKQYVALNLLGKTMRYTTDMSGAGCGCNAALYLVSMRQNPHPSTCDDFYCDANSVCGQTCAEVDIQEANQHAWHSTLHAKGDRGGEAKGFGGGGSNWNGPRAWTALQYGPIGRCINTLRPFQVAASFPIDAEGTLAAMEVVLSQAGSTCKLSTRIDSYEGIAEVSKALTEGMTPVVSYWSADDMLWLDGKGGDGKGPCASDDASRCSDAVKFYDFAILSIGQDIEDRPPRSPIRTTTPKQKPTTTPSARSPGTTATRPVWLPAAANRAGRASEDHISSHFAALRALEPALQTGEAGSATGFCCLAASDTNNFCGSCFPRAKAKSTSHCGGSAEECLGCGGDATWCGGEEEHELEHQGEHHASNDDGFCCLAAPNAADFCGTCYPAAVSKADSTCGSTRESCEECGGQAKWCAGGSPPAAGPGAPPPAGVAAMAAGPAAEGEDYCCLAAPNAGDMCGTCWSAAKAVPGSRCGGSMASCHACGGLATWCSGGRGQGAHEMWLRIDKPDIPLQEGDEALLDRNGVKVPLEVVQVGGSPSKSEVVRRYDALGVPVVAHAETWRAGPIFPAAVTVAVAVAIASIARLSGFRLPRHVLASAADADGLSRTL